MAKIIYLIYSVAYNIYNILVRNGYNKICAFAICKQTDVSHANRRHGAACMSAGVDLAAGGVLRWCVLRVATSGADPSTQAGHPPLGHLKVDRRHSPKFFYFFEEEEHKQE